MITQTREWPDQIRNSRGNFTAWDCRCSLSRYQVYLIPSSLSSFVLAVTRAHQKDHQKILKHHGSRSARVHAHPGPGDPQHRERSTDVLPRAEDETARIQACTTPKALLGVRAPLSWRSTSVSNDRLLIRLWKQVERQRSGLGRSVQAGPGQVRVRSVPHRDRLVQERRCFRLQQAEGMGKG